VPAGHGNLVFDVFVAIDGKRQPLIRDSDIRRTDVTLFGLADEQHRTRGAARHVSSQRIVAGKNREAAGRQCLQEFALAEHNFLRRTEACHVRQTDAGDDAHFRLRDLCQRGDLADRRGTQFQNGKFVAGVQLQHTERYSNVVIEVLQTPDALMRG